MGKIYVIMGKSASGKDHIYPELLKDASLKLKPLVLYTTRPKRIGEKDGREYFFTNEDYLKKLRAAGKIIEERAYPTVHGDWYYFTADDGQIKENENYLTIGTLQSYVRLKAYFGEERLRPIYIDSDPYLRLKRAIGRERKQAAPEYKEVCRRFLTDEEDFSEEKLKTAEIESRFQNDGELKDCIAKISNFIKGEV